MWGICVTMLEFEPGLIIWTTVSFGMLVLLLYKVALPPILTLLAEREKLVKDSIDQAVANRERSEGLLAEYRDKLARVSDQAEQMIQAAKAEGEKLRMEILERAEKQAEFIAEKSRQDLSREKDKIIAEVRQSTAELVALAAGKVIRRLIKPEDNRRLIEESLLEAER